MVFVVEIVVFCLVLATVSGLLAALALGRAARRRSEEDAADLVRQLRATELELEVRTAELDTFAHAVAHDLKNPIGVVLGGVSLLTSPEEGGGNLGKEQAEIVEMISRAGRNMLQILDEKLLLAASRRVSADPGAGREPTELKPIREEAEGPACDEGLRPGDTSHAGTPTGGRRWSSGTR